MESTANLRAELIDKFGSSIEDNEELLAECVNICQIFNLSAESLFWKWEASNFNTKKGAFTLAAARDLKESLQQEQVRNVEKQRRANLTGMLNRPRGTAGVLNIGRFTTTQTPVKTEQKTISGLARKPVAGPSCVKFHDGPLQTEEAKKGRAFRYMYEKISERSELLDDRIDEFADIFREAYNIEEFGDPAAITEEEVYVAGRIALDAESLSSGTVKLNEESVVLESSRMMGSGVRVPLQFSPDLRLRGITKGSGGIGLFPGAMIAVRGRNGGGRRFVVSEIFSLPPLKRKELKSEETANSDATLLIASGPFTADSDLSYEPWQALVEKMRTIKPDVILLTGPFIDGGHQKIKAGDVSKIPLDMFRDIFLESLKSILDLKPGSIALLVPSVRDILSDHAVLPQSELDRNLVDDPRLHLLPNPTKFSLDGRSFAVTSVDVLFHVKKEEFTKRGEEVDPTHFPADEAGTDAFASVCRHVLRQRSLYPVFPVPTDLSHEVNLDVSHMDGLALTYDSEEPAPDVIVLPSRYKQFYKIVDGTMVINPSFVSKSTFVTMSLGASIGSGVEISRVGS